MKPYGEPTTEVPAPPKPDPRITPQTVIGNYPRQDREIAGRELTWEDRWRRLKNCLRIRRTK